MTNRGSFVLAALLVLSLVAPLAGASAAVVQSDEVEQHDAELHIEQPHYVDSDPAVDTAGNYTTYKVSGAQQRIVPQNFDQKNVVDYGVREEQASLSVDQELGGYVLNAEADATYHVYFVTQTERLVEVETNDNATAGNETATNETETKTELVTDRQRYVAQIQVDGSNKQLIAPDKLGQLKEDSTNWQEWVGGVKEIAGADANIERKTQLALNLLNIRENPGQLVTGEFWYIGFIIFGTFSGAAWVVIWLFYDWRKNRELAKKVNEVEALEVEEADLDEKLLEFENEDRRRLLVNTNAHDWCDDEFAARGFIEGFGKDNLTSYVNFSQVVSGGYTFQDRLMVMGKEGYSAAAVQNDDGEIVRARVLPKDADEEDLANGEELVDLFENADELSEIVDPMDEEVFQFDLTEADVDLKELGVELQNPTDIDELIAELDADMQRFQDKEEAYVKYLHEFVEHVREHPFTDADGSPKTNRYITSMFLQKAQVARDMWDMPLADLQSEYLEKLLKEHDPVEDAELMIDRDEKGVPMNAD